MKKLLSVLLCAIFLLGMTVVSVSAEETDVAPIDVSFSTRKDNFDANDTIRATLEIRNTNPYPLTNLTVKIEAPEGYEIKKEDKLPCVDVLKAGKKASYTIKMVPQGKKTIGTGTIVILVGGVLLTSAAVATVLILMRRKKLRANAVVSALIVCIMVANIGAMWLPVEAATVTRFILTQEIPLTIDGQPQKAVATVYYDDNPLADNITLDTSRLSYFSVHESFVTTQDFDGFHGTLAHPKQYQTVLLEVLDPQGHVLQEATTNAAKQWHFSEVILCPGNNHVRITAVGDTPLVLEFDLIDLYGNTYHLLEGYEDDTDKDGLPDLVENALGTDPTKADTDGDGISDNDELNLDLDPTKADTNGDGVPDGKEDSDDDGLSNSDEIKKGLSPVFADTDRDGIDDNDELKKHKTNPLETDSDADGAEDGWELDHGYSPTKSDKSFALSVETAPVSELNPVSAAVSLNVSGKKADVSSLAVDSVSVADNPYLSSCIAGYLGTAYDFTLDGTFDSATLTFRYDPSLGKVGKDFQPQICYFNPDTQELEPLPNQTVKDGVVTAKTTHFSTYALVDITKWMTTLQKDYVFLSQNSIVDINDLATADIAIVMDNSASIAWNDPDEKCKEVATYFVNHIRPKYDAVSLTTYTSTSTPLVHLTSDPTVLLEAINRIQVDNGVNATSGTNGAAAIYAAIDSLRGGGGSHRYVLFFSDGDDESLQKEYDAIVQRATRAQVKLLCVGIHTTKTSILSKMASATKGHYYVLDEGVDVEKAFGHAISVFDQLTPSDTDSNQDGISDFITTMIREGKLSLMYGNKSLSGIDFSVNKDGVPSDDWDGDGLKNGEELKLYCNPLLKLLGLKMTSHPCITDSDADGFQDKVEVDNHMNPMLPSVQAKPIDYLLGRDFHYVSIVDKYDADTLPKGWKWLASVQKAFLAIDGAIFAGGRTAQEEIYFEVIAQYILKHGHGDQEATTWRAYIRNIISYLDEVQSECIDNHIELANNMSDSTVLWDLNQDIFKLRIEILENPSADLDLDGRTLDAVSQALTDLQVKIPVKWNGNKTTKEIFEKTKKWVGKTNDITDTIGDVGEVLTYAEAGIDLFNTYKLIAKVEANNELFLTNLEILETLSKSDSHYTAKAANDLIILMSDSFLGEFGINFEQTLREIYQLGLQLIPDLLKCVPVVGTAVAIIDGVVTFTDLLLGIGTEVECTHKILCYDEMIQFYRSNARTVLGTSSNQCYGITEKNMELLLGNVYHLEQLHTLAENEHYDLGNAGLLNFATKKEKEQLKNSTERIEKAADAIRNAEIYHESRGGGGSSF